MQLSWSRTSNQADETVGRNRAFASPVTTWPDRRIRDSLGANHCEEHTHTQSSYPQAGRCQAASWLAVLKPTSSSARRVLRPLAGRCRCSHLSGLSDTGACMQPGLFQSYPDITALAQWPPLAFSLGESFSENAGRIGGDTKAETSRQPRLPRTLPAMPNAGSTSRRHGGTVKQPASGGMHRFSGVSKRKEARSW